MKSILTIAALFAATVPASAEVAAPSRALPWLLAEVAVCELDGSKLPHRTEICRRGTVWFCGAHGRWEDTRRPC